MLRHERLRSVYRAESTITTKVIEDDGSPLVGLKSV